MHEFLKKVPLFADLADDDLKKLCKSIEEVKLLKGETLFEEGAPGDRAFVIRDGEIEIIKKSRGREVLLATRESGEVFGEMALVDQGMRSATAQTTQDNTFILRLPREKLIDLCDSDIELGYKVMKNLAADLAQKMRNTGLTLRQYQMMLSQKEAGQQP